MNARWTLPAGTILLIAAILAGCGRGGTIPVTDPANPPLPPEAAMIAAPEAAPVAPAATAAPGVSLATVDDIAAFLDDNAGKVLVINFWATWCAPCVHEMPELAAFYDAYKDRGVAFLSLSSDSLEDYESKLVPFVEERDLPFHVYAIANADPDELDAVLNVGMDFALPTTFVFDRDRKIAQKWMRNITRADLERVVEPLLSTP